MSDPLLSSTIVRLSASDEERLHDGKNIAVTSDDGVKVTIELPREPSHDTELVSVSELRVGDAVDLEGDPFGDGGRPSIIQSEYVLVENVERETPECIRVDFADYDSIGFPVNHKVKRRLPNETAAAYEVTLHLTIRGDEMLPPERWDWPTLLRMQPDDCEVGVVEAVNEAARQHRRENADA